MHDERICAKCLFGEICLPEEGDCESCDDYSPISYWMDEDEAIEDFIESEKLDFLLDWADYIFDYSDSSDTVIY